MSIAHALHLHSRLLLSAAVLFMLAGCAANRSTNYPAARGFKLENSDPQAVKLADKVMVKLGGWENWEKTRYVTWKFFGRRLHV